jgi:uncharacterized protein YjbI with pentapeptide repeats
VKYEIKSRFDGRTLYECEAESLLQALQEAVSRSADLRDADLRDADLRGAYLRGADLRDADLSGADLRDADLRDAYLRGADLRGADLRGAKINWNSHSLLTEILLRAAGEDIAKRMVAGLILVSRDWYWDEVLDIKHELMPWAIATLAEHVQDGDDAPAVLVRAKAAKADDASKADETQANAEQPTEAEQQQQ